MKDLPKNPGEILLADDDAQSLHALSAILIRAGYTVREAGSGELALWSAARRAPDLIVLDAHLPGMSGLEVCHALKCQPETASIPVIFLSTIDTTEERVAGFDAGAADFIAKPLVPTEALARIRTHIGMSITAKELLRRHQLSTPTATKTASTPEILIVEDTPESLQLLSAIMVEAGYTVREAPNGELALWTATRHPPDLILLDIRMPGMNGYDVCRCLKADPATALVPIIFISAFSDLEHKSEGFDAGAVDYITKPFDASEVLVRVRNHLRLAETVRPSNSLGHEVTQAPEDLSNTQIINSFASSTCAVMFLDAGHRITYVNPAFVRLSGYSLGDLAGQDPAVLFPAQKIPFATAAPMPIWVGEVSLKTCDGKGMPCQASISQVDGDDFSSPCRIMALHDLSHHSDELALIDSPALREFAADLPYSPALEDAIHGALLRNEMHLVFQPIFHLANGKLAGAEALLRWQTAEHGLLLPAEFLAVAEETGEIIPIGDWVLAVVCDQLARWQKAFSGDFKVAINLSSLQFWQDSLSDHIEQTLRRHNLPASMLQIEITPEILREDVAQGIAVLHRLKALGISLVIDRFGHEKLEGNVLSRLPVDYLKSDPRPILSMKGDPASQGKVRSMADLAHGRSLLAVANGIEEKWQLAMMQACQYDLGQGYLLGAPVAAEDFMAAYAAGWHE